VYKAVLKSGTWFSFKHPKDGEIRLGQGRERARDFLIDNPDLAEELRKVVLANAQEKPVILPPVGESGASAEDRAAPSAD
jgi:recombination protein RecA